MTNSSDTSLENDPFHLNRFVQAQQSDYDAALAEIRAGRKAAHWMWFIFPQFQGLGFSSLSQHFAIKSWEEARSYLTHPVLGPRLLECCEALMTIEGRTARQIFGSPDDAKLRSCATLFAQVSAPNPVFERLLKKYFGGQSDSKTLELLGL